VRQTGGHTDGRHPLVLVLEDLHWSDSATLDLVALLARWREPARLLLLVTYRPEETQGREDSLLSLVRTVQASGHGVDLPLALLRQEVVAAYVAARCPRPRFPAALATRLHQLSDGNPLFLHNVVTALIESGVLVEQDGSWSLSEPLDAVTMQVPDS